MRLMGLFSVAMLIACGSSHDATRSDGGPGEDAGSSVDSGGGGVDAGTAADAGDTMFSGAYISAECAPDDGPALSLIIYASPVPECSADDAQPSLTFYIFEGSDLFFPIEAPETVTSTITSGGFGNGNARYCVGLGVPCLDSSTWTLAFDEFVTDSRASGTYSVTFGDGTVLDGAFDATWCMFAPVLCG